MPAADVSGEVFSLNADAAYEGLVTARAGAGAQLGVTVEAEACHGLSLEASASAMAQANASFGFLLAARGTGFGRASAGLAGKRSSTGHLRPLRPHPGGRSSSGRHPPEGGCRLASTSRRSPASRRTTWTGSALQLFLAFLEEMVLEAGRARFAAAAMVAAHADITVSLKDDADAGLLIEAGAAAGLAAGAGFDFFAAARFDDVRRFYGRSVRLITKEASKRLRQVLPINLLKWAAEIVELALPTALQTVYDLGQTSSLASLTPERLIEPLLAAFSQTGRTYVVDKAIDAVPELLELLVDRLVDAINDNEFDFDRDELDTRLEPLDDYLDANIDREVELEDLPVLAGFMFDVVDTILPEEAAGWRDAMAVLWTATSVAAALERPVAEASASASAVGFGGATAPAMAFDMGPAPTFVLEAYHDRLGRNLSSVEFADAVEFLTDAVADGLAELLPEVGFVLDDLADRFGLTVGEFVGAAATLTFGGDLTAIPAYQKLRTLLGDWLDGVLGTEIIPALQRAGASDEYVSEVAAPSLQALESFVLAKLDEVVGSGSAGATFTDKLSAGCSTLVYGIVIRNGLFLETVLFEYVLDNLEAAFQALARAVRRRPRPRPDADDSLVARDDLSGQPGGRERGYGGGLGARRDHGGDRRRRLRPGRLEPQAAATVARPQTRRAAWTGRAERVPG